MPVVVGMLNEVVWNDRFSVGSFHFGNVFIIYCVPGNNNERISSVVRFKVITRLDFSTLAFWHFLVDLYHPQVNYMWSGKLLLAIVCFLLGDLPVSEVYMPTLRNTSIFIPTCLWRWNRRSETLAYNLHTLVNHPEKSILHAEEGRSLKSRVLLACSRG
jgi:hypothetical protein